ncbi:Uncharacterised protein [Mycobacteroides abscessus subsp. abscessus]|nr:Uncharacterised protein [Mycobacteroides abscessus subsp. abscessus]
MRSSRSLKPASSALPDEVACAGDGWPIQVFNATLDDPCDSTTLIACAALRTARLVVSPVFLATSSQTSWPSLARSIVAVVDPASLTTVKPMRYLRPPGACSTKPRDSSEATIRETVDLWTPRATDSSVIPAAPASAINSMICSARSTDCTAPPAVLSWSCASVDMMLMSLPVDSIGLRLPATYRICTYTIRS